MPAGLTASPQSTAQTTRWTRIRRSVTEDADALLVELATRAPHAALGYDAATEQRYKADPRSVGQSMA